MPAQKNSSLSNKFRLTIFWKIFGWFWLTIVVLITIFLFIGYINSGKIHYRPLPPPVHHDLSEAANRIEKSFNRRINIERRSNRRMRDILLLDQQGNEIFERQVPELLAQLHSRVKRHQQPLTAFRKREAYVGGTLLNIKGEQYWLYMQQRHHLFSAHIFRNFFRDIATVLFFATFIISFPVSFALSWLITRPIKNLQQATQDIQENLSKRDNLHQLNSRGDEFGELARDFDNMANHLSKVIASQKQLVSDVSHELRSPLTRLQIALGMAEKASRPENLAHIERIKLETGRMNNMLENLLALSKLEAQEIDASKEDCDLCQIINAVVGDGRFEAEQSGIEISLDLPDDCTIQGVKEALISGIENVLRNAIRYAGENGNIKCRLQKTDNELELTIRDSGPGVPQEKLSKLFDAFYRPELDRARYSGGVGLGLSIAKRAFALNGGEISASNLKPHGLEVTVTFAN